MDSDKINLSDDIEVDNNKRKKSGWKKPVLIMGGIILGIILLGGACSSLVKDFTAPFSGSVVEEHEYADISDSFIGVVYVEGTIMDSSGDLLGLSEVYDHQWTLEQIDDLIANSNNKAMVVYVDSPGGGVYESDELYLKIKEYQEETGRPVYVSMGSMAASGGYYISANADKIIANRNCWTGSIGVTIGTLYDFSGLLEEYGIETVTIDSGENKSMGGSTEPMTEEQKEIFQSLVDESYEQFVGIVAEGRDMKTSEVKPLADGRIYTAKQAKNVGLVDEIGTLDETIAMLEKDHGLAGCEVYDIQRPEETFMDILLGKLDALSKEQNGDVKSLLEIVNEESGFPVSYMCEMLK